MKNIHMAFKTIRYMKIILNFCINYFFYSWNLFENGHTNNKRYFIID